MWSEILRPILRWPLRSPLRLLASIAAVLVLIFGLGSLNRQGGNTRPIAQATATTDEQSGADQPSGQDSGGGAGGLDEDEEEAAPEPPAIAVQRAAAFLTAWARPTVPADQWRADLAPFVDPLLAQGLALTDPVNVPASRVVDAGTLVRSATRSALYDFATDAGTVQVTMTSDGITWWVSEVTPQKATSRADTPEPTPGADGGQNGAGGATAPPAG